MTDPREIAAALEVVTARASQARAIARRAIGAVEPAPSPVPVAALVADAALGLAMEAKRANVTLSTQVDPALGGRDVAGGPALLQVLTNLLLNAIAFSPAGSTVRLSAAADAADAGDAAGADGGGADRSSVLLRVDDEGPGIAPEQRAHLFEAGVTSRRGGAGIGLRHSAALAAEAGGELRLGESVIGTRFELRWPLVSAADRGSPGPESTERPVVDRPSIDGARILVVEDDAAVIELLELALEARGASVVSIQARSELPRALSTGRFDAALLDMSPLLGDVDGAVSELRRASPDARLVVMSGSVPHAEVGGASVWVRKPFEVREIVDALSAPAPAAGSKIEG
jgi:CheY-like chemotaxis protein